MFTAPLLLDFYPRPPRGGRPPAELRRSKTSNFYPRPPRGGRPELVGHYFEEVYFYPRPPRGGRPFFRATIKMTSRFLSTSPARGTTRRCFTALRPVPISIHVPREGDDPIAFAIMSTHAYFYPRPPRGGRPATSKTAASSWHFYPRPPRGGRRGAVSVLGGR